jgi:hypothetical protein
VPLPRSISSVRSLFGNLAQSSHYEVKFGGLPLELSTFLLTKGINPLFTGGDFGLLCFSASLPTSTFGVAEVSPFIGVREKIAHTRLYTNIGLEFYVDSNYNTLKLLEHWMDYISSGSASSPTSNDYFIRMQYPSSYKSNQTKIVKFDRDYNREIEYTFRGLFPVAISSIPISYGTSDVLKVAATFEYDRYICGKTTSISVFNNTSENRDPVSSPPAQNRVPMSPGSVPSGGVVFRPANLTPTEAIVRGELYTSLTGNQKAV